MTGPRRARGLDEARPKRLYFAGPRVHRADEPLIRTAEHQLVRNRVRGSVLVDHVNSVGRQPLAIEAAPLKIVSGDGIDTSFFHHARILPTYSGENDVSTRRMCRNPVDVREKMPSAADPPHL